LRWERKKKRERTVRRSDQTTPHFLVMGKGGENEKDQGPKVKKVSKKGLKKGPGYRSTSHTTICNGAEHIMPTTSAFG